jgi:hypothetical protein
MPLHLFCVWLMALCASLAGAGAYGLVLWRTGKVGWAVLGAALFFVLPANYRTIGFVLVREDLSFPLFALHLALLALACRRGGGRLFLVSGAALAAALATWHAMGFFAAMELVCLLAWAVFRPQGPAPRGFLAGLIPVVVVGTLVPALRASGFLFSPAALLLLALAVVLGPGSTRSRAWRGAAALVCLALPALAARLLDAGATSYAHVFDLLLAKLVNLGRLPADPSSMSFDARLLWQGPFQTLDPSFGFTLLGWSLLCVPAALHLWLRRTHEGRGADRLLVGFVLLALLAAWWVQRTVILAGLLAPALLAVYAAGLRAQRAALVGFLLVLLLQAGAWTGYLREHRIAWYEPLSRNAEIAALLHWIDENVDEEQAIASDFVNATAILQHCGNPIVLQPKYETERSRRRAEQLVMGFFHDSPEDFRRLVRERFQCRYLVVDRWVMLVDSRYLAGLGPAQGMPRAGTPAALLTTSEEAVLTGVPGYELLYRSPEGLRRPDGSRSDRFRVFRLD